ncbi:hypothetical protein SARC_04211 [Sphaeroforma arctica JP610]|uniref:Helicase C-terminal domain-containing protein n=1 Tax=Sphaeroforma arctica JP610 TaxID=667725 RepID=A0A0L0G5L3_9EUKA|nr:hypothetical protein SARC_04211 [Sphaeroforma arctica JP610]KNC83538.1 hypothetical protein SARC_04211 [Sphaeroforma arctica JP610]|eukprot:XP_014157440.1 hypothetical protein SARC_04211 [Sphaeroforma arctica JP610]
MVFRRLLRMCAHYGADPQWIMCTATIANPREHSLRLIPLDVPDEPEHKQADTDTHPESTLRAEDSAEMGVDQPETVQRGTDMDCTELSEDGTSIQPPDNPRQTSSTPQTRPTTSTDRYIDTPHVTHTDTDGQISVDTQVQAPERNERISTNTQTQAPETLKQVPTSTHTQAPDRPSVDMRRRLVVVGEDGSPNGRKDYVLWNPAAFSSVYTEAGVLLCEMAKTGLRTIGFCKVRSVCELVCKVTQSMMREGTSVTTLGGNRHKTKGSDCSGLPAPRPDLVPYITTYRGGYTAMDRRKIERDLFGGRLLSVIATNALELGIDVGSLDSVLQLGYPGSIASLWQQAGRAGRSGKQSIAVLIGYNSPLDQHFMKNPKALFSKASEAVVFDPFNNRVLWWHLLCAATELPLCAGTKNYDARLFGDKYGTLIQDMVRGMAVDGSYNAAHGAVIRAANNNYHTTSHAIDFPHGKTSLRNIYTESMRESAISSGYLSVRVVRAV